MSVNRDAKAYEVWEKIRGKTPSGAEKTNWKKIRNTLITVYKKNDMLKTGSVKYNEATHTGLTKDKEFKAGKHQLRKNETVYDITEVNPDGRLTVLLLKEVDIDA